MNKQKGYIVALICSVICLWAGQAAADEPLAKITLSGELQQGGVIFGRSDRDGRVFIDGREVVLDQQHRFVFGLDRDAAEGVTVVFRHANGVEQAETYPVAKREYRMQRIEGIKRSIMQPSEEKLQRIREEAAQVKRAREADLDQTAWHQRFIWPIKGRITGVFGSQRVYNGVPARPHYGIDIAAPVGAKVIAPAAGVVTLAHKNMFYSGGTVIIDHGRGLSSAFLHLSKLHVKVGQQLQQGDLLGEVGSTGRSTGPHLDWRMNWFDRRVDAQLMVPAMR
ncbi:peptidase M23-like protein [Sinobacterium caligoides]|uniref:Peptidase M23-like protein n=1 Tax=Sinobacterium caligoides TaxID=933926 RepID=A0A3N2DNK4_9GAMM|nr:M23 family metallopeptidase [Sinobacterium caligoides]ROS01360.1 peptidase M23-like protein [Sinobacterium caligoides]